MPTYLCLLLICFCIDIAGEEHARERRIREGRVHKGKPAMTNSARKEMEVENLYVPMTRRRREFEDRWRRGVRFTVTDGLLLLGG